MDVLAPSALAPLAVRELLLCRLLPALGTLEAQWRAAATEPRVADAWRAVLPPCVACTPEGMLGLAAAVVDAGSAWLVGKTDADPDTRQAIEATAALVQRTRAWLEQSAGTWSVSRIVRAAMREWGARAAVATLARLGRSGE